MRVRIVLAVMAAMMLASCWWAGPAFFTADPTDAAPIKPGRYQISALDTSDAKAREKSVRVRIVWEADGTTRWIQSEPGKPDDVTKAIMARLSFSGRDLWIVQSPLEKSSAPVMTPRPGTTAPYLYSLVEMRAGVMWMLPVIDCAATADIVRTAGGTVTDTLPLTNQIDLGADTGNMTDDDPPPAAKDCTFPTRATLDTALKAYLATNPTFTQRLRFKRLGD